MNSEIFEPLAMWIVVFAITAHVFFPLKSAKRKKVLIAFASSAFSALVCFVLGGFAGIVLSIYLNDPETMQMETIATYFHYGSRIAMCFGAFLGTWIAAD